MLGSDIEIRNDSWILFAAASSAQSSSSASHSGGEKMITWWNFEFDEDGFFGFPVEQKDDELCVMETIICFFKTHFFTQNEKNENQKVAAALREPVVAITLLIFQAKAIESGDLG